MVPENPNIEFVDMSALPTRYASLCLARYNLPFGRFRYDINPRSRSEHIERVSAYRTPQVYIENPQKRIYIDALCFK